MYEEWEYSEIKKPHTRKKKRKRIFERKKIESVVLANDSIDSCQMHTLWAFIYMIVYVDCIFWILFFGGGSVNELLTH